MHLQCNSCCWIDSGEAFTDEPSAFLLGCLFVTHIDTRPEACEWQHGLPPRHPGPGSTQEMGVCCIAT